STRSIVTMRSSMKSHSPRYFWSRNSLQCMRLSSGRRRQRALGCERAKLRAERVDLGADAKRLLEVRRAASVPVLAHRASALPAPSAPIDVECEEHGVLLGDARLREVLARGRERRLDERAHGGSEMRRASAMSS